MDGFYINLKHDEKRKNHMENLKNKYDFFKKIQREEAVYHKNGATGCYLSHINCLKKLENIDGDYFLILEDDFCILNENNFNDFVENFESIKNNNNWSMLILTPRGSILKTNILNNFNRIKDNQTSTGYIIKKSFIKHLLEIFIDGVKKLAKGENKYICALDQFWKPVQLKTNFIYFNKIFAGQLEGYSNIEKKTINYNERFLNQATKYDLTKTTFMIPLRIEHPDRLTNIKIIIKYLTTHFNTNIIILEDGKKSHYEEMELKNYKNIEYIFLENNENFFHRTKYLNYMLLNVKTPVVVNYDSDIVLSTNSYLKAQHLILNKNYDVVIPYSNPPGIKYILQEDFHLLKEKYDVNDLKEVWNKKESISYKNDEELSYNMAGVGGCVFFNTQSYLSLGGENEDFKSWGAEDQERIYRFKRLNYKIYNEIEQRNNLYPPIIDNINNKTTYIHCKCEYLCNCNHICVTSKYEYSNSEIRLLKNDFEEIIHLEHYRGINSGDENPYFKQNEELWNNILNYNYNQLENYYYKKSNFDSKLFLQYLINKKIPFYNKDFSDSQLYNFWKQSYKKYNIPFFRKQ